VGSLTRPQCANSAKVGVSLIAGTVTFALAVDGRWTKSLLVFVASLVPGSFGSGDAVDEGEGCRDDPEAGDEAGENDEVVLESWWSECFGEL
jgi:hypothetical protein